MRFTWVWCAVLCGGSGNLGGAVCGVDKGVKGGGYASLLPQVEHTLQPVEVIIVQHQQGLRIHPAASHSYFQGFRLSQHLKLGILGFK